MNKLRIPSQYEFSEIIKKDDLGSVSIITEKVTGTKFIFKEITPEAGSDFIRRFLREAEVLSGLSHPNIISVIGFGHITNPYIILQYFEGMILSRFLREYDPDTESRKRIFGELLSGIAYAHDADVIHRDIKPENILIGKDLSVKIIDFGLALKENESGKTIKNGLIGTPSYIAPEILSGEPASKATDLFALGITGLEIFSGTNPFAGHDINDTINRLLSYDGSLPAELLSEIPDEYRQLIKILLSSDSATREIPSDYKRFTLQPDHGKRFTLSGYFRLARKYKYAGYAGSIALTILLLTAVLFASDKLFRPGESNTSLVPAIEINDSSPVERKDTEGITVTSGKTSEKESENIKDEFSENASADPAPEESPEADIGYYNIKVMPWAKVYIDGEYLETTPLKSPLKLKAGKRKLKLFHPVFGEFETPISVKKGITSDFLHNFSANSGYLRINVFPWGEVFINDKSAGLTPLQSPLQLNQGEYKVTVRNPAFDLFEKKVNIRSGDTLVINHTFN